MQTRRTPRTVTIRIRTGTSAVSTGITTDTTTTDQFVRPNGEFAHAEGFGHVIGRAEFETTNDVGLARTGREHQHRHIAEGSALADAIEDLKAVHLRHHDVKDEKVGHPAVVGFALV